MSAPRQLGRYLVERPLGSGGMGVVFLARAEDGRQVALKSLATGFDPEAMARFRREAKLLAKLRHPGVCGLVELVEQGPGAPFLVLEYVPGQTLAELVRDDLPVERAVDIMIQVCDAVAHAHAATILHRDLKPTNVIVTPDDRAVVLDFGLARRLGDAESQAFSRTGDILGTPGFMPPEQALGEEITPRADVYGLGATLYATLTGEPPFRRNSAFATLDAVLNTAPIPPSRLRADVSPGLEAICLRALAKSPPARFPTAAALGEALQAWRASGDSAGPGARRVVGAALTFVVVGGIVAAAVSSLRAPSEPSPVAGTPTAVPVPSMAVPSPSPPSGPVDPLKEIRFEQRYRAWGEAVTAFEGSPLSMSRSGLGSAGLAFQQVRTQALRAMAKLLSDHSDDPRVVLASARVSFLFGRYAEAAARAKRLSDLPAAQLLLAQSLWRELLWEFRNGWAPITRKRAQATLARETFEQVRGKVETQPIDHAYNALYLFLMAIQETPDSHSVLRARGSDVLAAVRRCNHPEARAIEAMIMVAGSSFVNPKRSPQDLLTRALADAPSSLLFRRLRGHMGGRSMKEDTEFVLHHVPNNFDLWVLGEWVATYPHPRPYDRSAELARLLHLFARRDEARGVAEVLRGALKLQSGEYDAALVHFAEAHRRGVASGLLLQLNLSQAQAEIALGSFQRARLHLQRGGYSSNPGTKILHAQLFHAAGMPEQARRILSNRRLQKLPGALLALGQVLEELEEYTDAVAVHFQAARTRPSPIFLFSLGHAQLQRNDSAGAKRTLSQLETRYPNRAETTLLRGFFWLRNKSLVKAEATFGRLIGTRLATREQRSKAYQGRSFVRKYSRNLEGAIEDLSQSLSLFPWQPGASRLWKRRAEWRAKLRKQ